MRRAVLALAVLVAACATPAPPARVAELTARAEICGDRPDIRWHEVTRDAVVRVAGRGDPKTKETAEKEFFDCVWSQGRWKKWVPGAPTVTQSRPLPPVTPPPAATAAPTDTPRPTDTRLRELETLRQQQLIGDEEYQATRKRILEGL